MRDRTEAQIKDVRRKAAKPPAQEPSGPPTVFDLQRSAGNAAVVSLLTEAPVQTKGLQVGAVNDPAEREADQVADQVLRLLQADQITRREDDAIHRVPDGAILNATLEEDEKEREAEEA